MKIAVMTDSTSYLSQELLDKYQIPVAPLSVIFDDGETFVESNDVDMEQFYHKMLSLKTPPTTSQPAIGEWIQRYEALRDQGYTDIIVICLSSGISGSYQSATQAGEMVEGVNVHSFDSKLAAMMEGSYVLHAINLVDKGFSPDDIIQELSAIREHTTAYLFVDDLKNLQKSGRITGAQAWVGTMLKMKPVLRFEDGKIVPEEKVRTKKRAYKSLEENIMRIASELDEVTIFVINGDKIEEGKAFYRELKEKYPESYNIHYSEFGPVVATHLGSGGLGLGCFGKKISIE